MKEIVKLEDPALNEYFYTIIFNCSTEDRLKLPLKYRKMVLSETAAKKFASTSTLDEKILVLSYLGVKHFLTLTDSGLMGNSSLREILKKYIKKEDYKALKEVVESGVYVTSNKQFVGLLSLISTGIHSLTYKMLMEEARVRYHAKKWTKKFLSANMETRIREDNELDTLYMRIICANNNVMKRCEFLFGLKESQMQVLLFMFPSAGNYIPIEKISDFLAGCFSKMEMSVAIKVLVDNKYLEPHPFADDKKYVITAAGINMVRKFQDAVDQLHNFGYA